MKELNASLVPGGFYHVYNRANGDEVLFRNSGNYKYFLESYYSYINPIAQTISYCLMPNHFHFLIQIRSDQHLMENLDKEWILRKSNSVYDYDRKLSKLPSQQFSNLFNSYALSFNKQHKRKGSLFIRNYKRIKVNTDTYLRDLILYIHLNPVKANYAQSPGDWEFSSYASIINNNGSYVNKDMLIDFFEDMNNFIFVHQKALQGL